MEPPSMPRRLRTRLLLCALIAALTCAIGLGIAYAAQLSYSVTHGAGVRTHRKHKRKNGTRRARDRKAHQRGRTRNHTGQTSRPPATTPPVKTPPVKTPPGTTTTTGSATPPITAPSIGPRDVVTPFPAGTRLFAADSVWNAPLAADAPLDSHSVTLSSTLNAEVRKEVAEIHGPWINTSSWSVANYTVGADVPRLHVTLDNYAPQLQHDFDAVPIPTGAQASPGSDGSLGDGSLVIYQPSTDTLWEFWLLQRRADGWHATWGGKMTNVSTNPGYLPSPYGGSGTSLALMGGLMTIRELQAGRIDHALALAIPNTATSIVWPAQRGDGRTTGPSAIPEGTHFRIDPSVDVTKLGLAPAGLAIARAAQKYGFIVRDTSGNVTFYGEDPRPLGGDPYGQIFGGRYPSQVLEGFPWDRLQVVAPTRG
jgi:hypothetical protein